MSDIDLTAMHRSELEAEVVNLAKLVKRFRDKVGCIVMDIQDEGDRAYFGSTNDADDLREIESKMLDSLNELEMPWTQGDDLYDMLRQRNDHIAALEASNARLEEALKPFAFIEMGKDEDEARQFTTQEVWETIYRDRVQDWVSFEDIERARTLTQPLVCSVRPLPTPRGEGE